ncbi:hypothetical protein SynRS9909_01662 [Synechococcus sp. RS9909]|uniref:hypothetical protein n=1 Tax=unclassified Synechococcus TaxID=2626047 RepID=UPI000068F7B3|nr:MULTISPECIES: hypothetical protein [unclassified Synechococcus]EAQ69096.1 hypothetical protein RS9917_11670 [Synechococcus sp. RS9917]QNI79646.1 hypothetical protein SynRS9909_01662 [Synechococcus sp. RS9909]
MSFDPRSLERLKELGRTLPQALPTPEAKPASTPKASERRHKVETEQNPEQLFRELMQVSPDGTVPEHLMQRLKEAEQRSQAERRPATAATSSPLPAPTTGQRPIKGKTTRPQRPSVAPGSEEESLYVAFGQLLLEDEAED